MADQPTGKPRIYSLATSSGVMRELRSVYRLGRTGEIDPPTLRALVMALDCLWSMARDVRTESAFLERIEQLEKQTGMGLRRVA